MTTSTSSGCWEAFAGCEVECVGTVLGCKVGIPARGKCIVRALEYDVGIGDGFSVGALVVGVKVGAMVGFTVGCFVGFRLGCAVVVGLLPLQN